MCAPRGKRRHLPGGQREIDDKVKDFLDRPIERDWPYSWVDGTYLEARRGGRIISVAAIIAVGVDTDGRREVLGMAALDRNRYEMSGLIKSRLTGGRALK